VIISRTPFRISLFGGGTDYPGWYKEHGGAVISASINKYCFITMRELPPFFPYKYRIRYYKREEVVSRDQIEHPSVREVLKFLNIENGVEVVHHADLPARSGLGSSSTFTVSMLHAGYALKSKYASKYKLAIDAINIEQNIIGEAVGSQDQTAAAFGGFNRINFGGQREVEVSPLSLNKNKIDSLQDHLLLFFTGFSRTASEVASEQIATLSSKQLELHKMMDICDEAENLIVSEENNIKEIGFLLNEQWMIKRDLTKKISNPEIDAIYSRMMKAGAIGGKLLGAGGGGFMLCYADPEKHTAIKESLKDLLHVPFRFDFAGSQIIYSGQHI
jgi:D-glycero-alpha-D-manno-heptose-7-phosphate kinase